MFTSFSKNQIADHPNASKPFPTQMLNQAVANTSKLKTTIRRDAECFKILPEPMYEAFVGVNGPGHTHTHIHIHVHIHVHIHIHIRIHTPPYTARSIFLAFSRGLYRRGVSGKCLLFTTQCLILFFKSADSSACWNPEPTYRHQLACRSIHIWQSNLCETRGSLLSVAIPVQRIFFSRGRAGGRGGGGGRVTYNELGYLTISR